MGPLQSWGERGRGEYRDSALIPTKSAVIGLLGCTLGLADDEALRQLAGALELGCAVTAPAH
jgi:CRISPR system Cascade subunit CasD